MRTETNVLVGHSEGDPTMRNTRDHMSRARGRRAFPLLLSLLLVAGAAGCDLLDPTEVENPRTTDEDLAAADRPVQALLPGARVQFARMIGSQAVISEVVSDNYSIHGTGLDRSLDDPRDIIPDLVNATSATQGIYWNMQELRAIGDFILDDVAPGDETATDSDLAEAHFYRAMAFLMLGENFTHAPIEEDGPAVPASDLVGMAVDDFEASLTLAGSGDFALASVAGLARAHRSLGNAAAATQHASDLLGADPSFAFQQGFDGSSVSNGPYIFLVNRAIKEMQPLPRLDFLDPKYLSFEAAVAIAKAEEMHLILAEEALSRSDMAAAADHIADAVRLADSRGVTSFVDDDPRFNDDLTPRPRDSEIVVRADPDSPFRAGLVVDRPNAEIPVPTISGTSLDADSVSALTDPDEIWHAFHLARQEVLMLEGRRMSDLGIRLPIMLREIDANPTIAEGDPGTVVVVPAYIPSDEQMDLFDPKSPYDEDGNLTTTEVTIRFDLNRILAENRVSAF